MPAQGVIRITTPDGQVREFAVDFDSAIVGRADGNRIVIPHVSVSRRHAHLTLENGQLMVEDFSSATGTYIDGRQVLAGERLPIPPGADVRFGEAQAVYIAPEVVAPPPPPPPPVAPPVAVSAAEPPPPVFDPLPTPEIEPTPAPEPPPIAYSPPPEPPPAPPAAPPPPPAAPRPVTHETSGAASAMAAQGEAQQRQFIGVNLSSPPRAVAPGQSTAATVVLQNRGQQVDEFTVSIAEIPASWVQIARPRITLLPGARDEVTIVIRPGEGIDGVAGMHRFTVVVQSREHGIDVRAIGELTVTPVEKLEAVLRPLKGKGLYTVEVTNRGNVVAPVVIDGSDDEGTLRFSAPEQVPLQPGETRMVPVKVTPRKKRKFGKESAVAFRLAVRSGQSSATPIRLDGNNVYRPPFERWKLPVAALLLLIGIGGGSYGVVTACTRDTGFCPELLNRAKDDAPSPTPTATNAAVAPTTETATEEPTEPTEEPGEPTATPDPNCPSTRLQPGMEAKLINSEDPRTFVRAGPSRDAGVIGQVGDDFRVQTIRCQLAANGEQIIFWEVTLSEPVAGVTSGWIAEQDPASQQFLLTPATP